MRKVKDIAVQPKMTVQELLEQLEAAGGFVAKKVGQAARLLRKELPRTDLRLLAFPGCIVATGTRGVLADMLKHRAFNAVITTCGTLDHEIARAKGSYLHGDFGMNDAKLRKAGISRLGNVLVPDSAYGLGIERSMSKLIEKIFSKSSTIACHQFCWEIGKALPSKTILHQAWAGRIPVIVPAPFDGAVGYQLWLRSQTKTRQLDLLADESLLNRLFWSCRRAGALAIGGGVAKHHSIWWAQFRGGLDWAVYISTAVEWDGSLSGARPSEAVSWGKIKPGAKTVLIEADATLVLPLLWAGIKGRIK